jgi:type II secretory pathway pseudopilin PulG
MNTGKKSPSGGFSLVEVVVAVGIFALAIVGVIGLFAPTSRNVANVADTDSASRMVSSIQSALQQSGYSRIQQELAPLAPTSPTSYYSTKSNDGNFYTASGNVVKKIDGSTADGVSLSDLFFEFTLLRNTTLSPVSNDPTAGFLAFTISLKWPAYLPDGTPVDDSAKSSLVVPAAITR